MRAINIVWDTDGLAVDLPTEVEIPESVRLECLENESDDEAVEWLSDEFGWCISSLDIIN
jgi:hypothetical protein